MVIKNEYKETHVLPSSLSREYCVSFPSIEIFTILVFVFHLFPDSEANLQANVTSVPKPVSAPSQSPSVDGNNNSLHNDKRVSFAIIYFFIVVVPNKSALQCMILLRTTFAVN